MSENSQRTVTECERCSKFFDDSLITNLNVKRSGSPQFFKENWCSPCFDSINSQIDIKAVVSEISSLLFSKESFAATISKEERIDLLNSISKILSKGMESKNDSA